VVALLVHIIHQIISVLTKLLIEERRDEFLLVDSRWRTFLYRLGMGELYVTVAFLMVFFVPSCSGSGIPEVKVRRWQSRRRRRRRWWW